MTSTVKIPEWWTDTTLGEIATFQQWFQISTDFQELEKKEWYVRFVRIVDYTNEWEKPRYIEDPHRCFVNEDDLVMIRYWSQTAGKIVRGISWVIANNTFQVITWNNTNKNRLYRNLKQESVYNYLNRDQSSSTMPAITFSQVSKLPIILPPLPEQKAIAGVLSSFDDKIELLRTENQTLEEMGQTLFKERFGKYKVWDELPDGWKVGRLGDIGDIICWKTPDKSESRFYGWEIPFIKIPDMHWNVFIIKTEDSLSEIWANTQKNKYIPSWAICVSCIATVWLVSITTKISQTNQQINSIVLFKKEFLEYTYYILSWMYNYLLWLWSWWSATLNINTWTFSNISLIIPEWNTISKFHSLAWPIFTKIKTNSEEIESLSKTRDQLLPKLMSWEVRVEFYS